MTGRSRDRYLAVLGVEPGPPTLDMLGRVVRAQLERAPFENISKLYLSRVRGHTTIPTRDVYLDGIERWWFGGTCYANNYHLSTLLDELGFETALCGADMKEPDVHMVSMVELDGRQYLVDVGYGAPFDAPLPRDLDEPYAIEFGRCRYILHPQDESGRSRLEMQRDGQSIHGYLAKPVARSIDHFDAVIRSSYRPEASFMNTVVVERFTAGTSVRFHNLKLTETAADGSITMTQLRDTAELAEEIERRCGIPAETTLEAIDGLSLSADIYS